MLGSGLVGRIDLFWVVAAAFQFAELVVRITFNQLEQFWVFAEELLADISAGLDGVFLILAVNDFSHAFDEQASFVGGKKRVPVTAPNHLDDVPARASEGGFQFLDDLAVAANRAIEPLKVAVDDEYQVVQLFSGGQGDGA